MPVCFKTAGGPNSPFAVDRVATLNPDGTTVMDPRTDYANCEFVVLNGADYSSWQQLGSMTIAEASVIGTAIGLVWAIAFGFRLVRKSLFDDRAEE